MIWWYDNGTKKFEEYYNESKKVGLWKQWYKSGQKMSERHYKDAKPHGRWTSWSEDGKITYQAECVYELKECRSPGER
jgi:antitoxin component YwqK of YwqJK toxin-antitoxin module